MESDLPRSPRSLTKAELQVGAEFEGDEGGEPVVAAALVGGPGQKGLQMALKGAVKHGVLGSVALIGGRGIEPATSVSGAARVPGSEKENNRKGLRRSSGYRTAWHCPPQKTVRLAGGGSAPAGIGRVTAETWLHIGSTARRSRAILRRCGWCGRAVILRR